MKKKYIILLIIIILSIAISIFSYPYVKPLDITLNQPSFSKTTKSNEIKSFIDSNLSRSDGAIYTNYLDVENNGDETKGHYILSESEGLVMEYALMTNNEEMFKSAYEIVKKDMMLKNGLISWRISKDNEKNPTSALIDELRISKCLIKAYLKFDKFEYKIAAVNLSKAMLKHSTYNGMVTDYNDGNNVSKTLTLCYIDVESMKLLTHVNEKWNNILLSGEDILEKGIISKDIPLFKKSYNLENNTYSNEENNELLYSLMVWENIIQTGKNPKPIIEWMDKQMKKYGCLYTKYSLETNEPVDYIESTSIYAVGLRIAKMGNNKELAEKLEKSLLKYQMKEGKLKGGIGMEKTKEAYSFDNLEAMISLLNRQK